jgi:hypothetical protein
MNRRHNFNHSNETNISVRFIFSSLVFIFPGPNSQIFLVNEKKTPKLAKKNRTFVAIAWTEFEPRPRFFFTFMYYIENKVQQLVN